MVLQLMYLSWINHAKEDCKIIHACSITNYQEDNFNKKSFKDFKNFLENIETLF